MIVCGFGFFFLDGQSHVSISFTFIYFRSIGDVMALSVSNPTHLKKVRMSGTVKLGEKNYQSIKIEKTTIIRY